MAPKPRVSVLQSLSVKLGKYETVAVLGEGGMSTVYRGRDAAIGREVAIKLLKRSESTDYLDLEARFLNEAKITGLLHHPSIALRSSTTE